MRSGRTVGAAGLVTICLLLTVSFIGDGALASTTLAASTCGAPPCGDLTVKLKGLPKSATLGQPFDLTVEVSNASTTTPAVVPAGALILNVNLPAGTRYYGNRIGYGLEYICPVPQADTLNWFPDPTNYTPSQGRVAQCLSGGDTIAPLDTRTFIFSVSQELEGAMNISASVDPTSMVQDARLGNNSAQGSIPAQRVAGSSRQDCPPEILPPLADWSCAVRVSNNGSQPLNFAPGAPLLRDLVQHLHDVRLAPMAGVSCEMVGGPPPDGLSVLGGTFAMESNYSTGNGGTIECKATDRISIAAGATVTLYTRRASVGGAANAGDDFNSQLVWYTVSLFGGWSTDGVSGGTVGHR
jgi:hypothetical protein